MTKRAGDIRKCGLHGCGVLTFCLSLLALNASAQEYNGQFPRRSTQSTDRIIVKWKQGARTAPEQRKLTQLPTLPRMKVQGAQQVASHMEVLQVDRRMSPAELTEAIATLTADPSVEFVAPDYRRHPHVLPNDALVSSQWYLLSTEVAALRAEAAWDVTAGSAGTVVAVLDTGVRFDHPDLIAADQGGKVLPGYDFISGESSTSFIGANDGNGRDPDASDPGDWVEQGDLAHSGFEDCEVSGSSWHGTRVAGIIAARTNNSVGMAGAAWNAWILPVRVMGKCGGRDSDIIAAMRWAAGLNAPGVPVNPYPAKIINLSLGGEGSCTSAYQATASELAARGVLIVASAGNEGGPVSAPANCTGVLGVAGVRQVGTKVGFSNLGPQVGIAAPGGNCVTTGPGQPCLFSIVTTTNLGSTTPTTSAYTDQLNFNVGTSFSAPMVSGTAALMHAVNARLGSEHLIDRLRRSASSFPMNPNTGTPNCRVPIGPDDLQEDECYCTTNTCGAGLVNANAAATDAQRPIASVQVPNVVFAGQNVILDASVSAAACNRTLASYEWSVISSTTTSPALSTTNESVTTVQAPSSGQFTLRVMVTDNTGAQDSADVTITPTSATTTASPLAAGPSCPTPISVAQSPPASTPNPAPSGGGGGGGQLGWELLTLVYLVFARRRFRSTLPRLS